MGPAIILDLLARARQHVGGQINANDFTMAWIRRKGRAGTGAHFENLSAGRNVKILDYPFQAAIEDLPKNLVIKWRELCFILVRRPPKSTLFPHPTQTCRRFMRRGYLSV